MVNGITLIQFTDGEGDPVWINPAQVFAVEREADGKSYILASNDSAVRVEGAPAEVAAKLMQVPTIPSASPASTAPESKPQAKPPRDYIQTLMQAAIDHDHRLSAIESHLAKSLANPSPSNSEPSQPS